MKAVRCHAYGPPEELVYEEVDPPRPGPREVLVDVKACGVNYPDLLIVQGLYQFKPPFPFSPGGEVAGTVAAVGGRVEGLAPGDRVIGLAPWGGFAERVVLDHSSLIPIPAGMSFEVAAAFSLTYGTALYALQDRGRLEPGETVLVLGAAGGVGTAAVQVAKALGARVIAAASTPDKLDFCRSAGADETIDYTREDLKRRAKSLARGGVDVVFDPVGGDYTEPALRATGWGGRYLVIGFAAGEIPSIPLNLVLLKGSAIVGVFWGSFSAREPERFRAQLETLAGWFSDGTIRPAIWKTYPLVDAARALKDLAERRVRGKIVLTTP